MKEQKPAALAKRHAEQMRSCFCPHCVGVRAALAFRATSRGAKRPPAELVAAVEAFLHYLQDSQDTGAQLNPRAELALILCMQQALHQAQGLKPQEPGA